MTVISNARTIFSYYSARLRFLFWMQVLRFLHRAFPGVWEETEKLLGVRGRNR